MSPVFSHTASEIIQLAKHIRRMGVSTVVIGSNIIRPTPRHMKETTYDRILLADVILSNL
jgi:lipoate synthase